MSVVAKASRGRSLVWMMAMPHDGRSRRHARLATPQAPAPTPPAPCPMASAQDSGPSASPRPRAGNCGTLGVPVGVGRVGRPDTRTPRQAARSRWSMMRVDPCVRAKWRHMAVLRGTPVGAAVHFSSPNISEPTPRLDTPRPSPPCNGDVTTRARSPLSPRLTSRVVGTILGRAHGLLPRGVDRCGLVRHVRRPWVPRRRRRCHHVIHDTKGIWERRACAVLDARASRSSVYVVADSCSDRTIEIARAGVSRY